MPTRSDRRADPFRAVMRQEWRELLFLHWRIDAAALARRVPSPLVIDTYEGEAWIGLVPFEVRGLRPPLLPPVPFASRFAEVNVRTYVRLGDEPPGVWFFSLDAASRLAVAGARLAYRLPYRFARGRLRRRGDRVRFASRRPRGCGRCTVQWRRQLSPDDSPAPAGSLEEFLIERYTLYAAAGGRLFRAGVRHRPYELVPEGMVELEGLDQDLVERVGFDVSETPRVHASRGVRPAVSAPQQVRLDAG